MIKCNHTFDDIGIWIKYDGNIYPVPYDMRTKDGEFLDCVEYGLSGFKSKCEKVLNIGEVTHVRLPNLNKRPSEHFKSNIERSEWLEAGNTIIRPEGKTIFGKF